MATGFGGDQSEAQRHTSPAPTSDSTPVENVTKLDASSDGVETVLPHRLIVRDVEAVKALFDNRQRAMLAPFFLGRATVSDAASQTEALPTTMLYFVRRMVKCGLLISIDEVRRSGKPVKRYCTSAKEFLVPVDMSEDFLLYPERRFQALFNEAMRDEIVRYNYQEEPVGALIKCKPNGVVSMSGGRGAGTSEAGVSQAEASQARANGPLVYFDWSVVRLSEEDARSFQRELAALSRKYRDLPEGDRSFYVGSHFAPLPTQHPPHRAVNAPRLDPQPE
jgi:hypothetical protein